MLSGWPRRGVRVLLRHWLLRTGCLWLLVRPGGVGLVNGTSTRSLAGGGLDLVNRGRQCHVVASLLRDAVGWGCGRLGASLGCTVGCWWRASQRLGVRFIAVHGSSFDLGGGCEWSFNRGRGIVCRGKWYGAGSRCISEEVRAVAVPDSVGSRLTCAVHVGWLRILVGNTVHA